MALVLLTALPVIALAIDLPETGQVTYYDAGGNVEITGFDKEEKERLEVKGIEIKVALRSGINNRCFYFDNPALPERKNKCNLIT